MKSEIKINTRLVNSMFSEDRKTLEHANQGLNSKQIKDIESIVKILDELLHMDKKNTHIKSS
jgi:alpha-galactosidase/6-phospho-beta-glucosidase family protein